MGMPRYQCHKKVWALKIRSVEGNRITPEESGYASFVVPDEFIQKHNPQIGGYFVVYEDGYHSYSPAKAFEEGYTLIR
ncbi:hypothetical protein MNODULE_03900 [Nitrospiraceae bacterium HYJII51-Mn-bac16s-1-B09]|uniref:Uncharacterized protein n=2 Tax=Candidatus Manganitrophus noduliformans TaxID=2606439 RepID=A0A7X6DMG4_9BACT|nr:hypothetical protein [Candidatus Manganitrophus noduliformans]